MLSHNYESYFDFAPMFTAEKFDPDQWAELFAKSGAKLVLLFMFFFIHIKNRLSHIFW